jgi:uncharacterized protein (DUF4415 family)
VTTIISVFLVQGIGGKGEKDMTKDKSIYSDGPDVTFGKVVTDLKQAPSSKQIKNAGVRVFKSEEIRAGIFEEITVHFTPPKKSVTIRYDEDIIKFFKSMGPGYQTRINDVLRAYVEYAKR